MMKLEVILNKGNFHMGRKLIILLLTFVLLAGGIPTSARADSLTIALSLPAETGTFYESLVDAAQNEADTLGVELVVLSSDNEIDTELSNIESLIDQQVDAILFSPTDPALSLPAVEAASQAGIPVFLLGSTLESASEIEVVSSLTSDNIQGGELAATTLCDAIQNTGTVIELVGAVAASESDAPEPLNLVAARERSEGFNSYMAENCSDVTILPLVVAGMDRETIVTMFSDLLREEAVVGVFGYDESSTLAAIEASISARKSGLTFVGFGATEDAIAAIQQGRFITAFVTPDAWTLGELGVQTSAAYLSGEEVEANITVDLAVVNLDTLAAFRCRPGVNCRN